MHGVLPLAALALEHVTLRSGFVVDCEHREVLGNRVRLYLPSSGTDLLHGSDSYLEVARDAIVRVDVAPDDPPSEPLPTATSAPGTAASRAQHPATLSAPEMHEILARVGVAHHIDEDLLASVVRVESGGRVGAVSRTGARGLMQLMPATSSDMGVSDAFVPEQNVAGGTAYLDALLTRYHDNVALALAAYNAGPAAVARWRGIPPYPETRAYVARVIREFNRRKLLAAAVVAHTRWQPLPRSDP